MALETKGTAMQAATRRSSESPGADDESDQRPISVAQGSALFFASSVVGSAGFFVASLLLARLLGPSGRGTVAFVTVSALLTAHVVKVGLGQATIVLAGRRPEARAALLTNLLAFSLLASLAGITLVVGGFYLFDVAPAGFQPGHLAILAAAIVAACLVDDNFLIGCGRLRAAAAISASGGWLCAGAVGIALAVGGPHAESAMIGWVAAHLVWAALLAGVGLRTAGASLPSIRLFVESMRFGVRAWFGNVSQFLNARADQLLVGVIATDVTLGLYVVAVNAAEVLLFLPNAVATSLLPALARERIRDGTDRTLRTFRSASVLTLASMAVTGAFGWLLIPVLFGADFQESVEPFLFLLPGALGYAALSIFVGALLAAQAPGLTSASRAVALGAGLMLDLALIPVFGASGAAAAASAAFLAGGATAAALYRRTTRFSWREIVPGRRDVAFLRLVAARAVPRLQAGT
ncbi:MAG TPA: oligosaccharide flippase family protein [Gaiella sp.]|nr:oligosaccharide flippase family protein [Gaiella sp.]